MTTDSYFIRPHICTALAADPTGEPLLDIGQPDIIRPTGRR
jgi:hypothetical protein